MTSIDYSKYEEIEARETAADRKFEEEERIKRSKAMKEESVRQAADDGSVTENESVPFINPESRNKIIEKLCQLSDKELNEKAQQPSGHNYTKRLVHAALRRKKKKRLEEEYEMRVRKKGKGRPLKLKGGFFSKSKKGKSTLLYADKISEKKRKMTVNDIQSGQDYQLYMKGALPN
eukprot:g892.t1